MDKSYKTNCGIHWIVIYPADSAIDRSNNWGLVFVVIGSGKSKVIGFGDIEW